MVGEKQRWANQDKESKEKSDYQQEYLLLIFSQNKNRELSVVQQAMDIPHVLRKVVIFIHGALISMDSQVQEINRQDGTQKMLPLMLMEINQVLRSKLSAAVTQHFQSISKVYHFPGVKEIQGIKNLIKLILHRKSKRISQIDSSLISSPTMTQYCFMHQ